MATIILIFHLLGASVWVGGHLILLLSVMPKALRLQNPEIILAFEERYERVGIPALIVQLLTGLWLAHRLIPGVLPAFGLDDRLHSMVALKLALLFATVVFGAHARFSLVPHLSDRTLRSLGWHIGIVTSLGVALLIIGAMMRSH